MYLYSDLNFNHVSAHISIDLLFCLLEEIVELLSVCKLLILAIGDCFTESSGICLSNISIFFTEFQLTDGSARWLTSFNFNYAHHTGTLTSTGPCCLLCSCCCNLSLLQRKKHFVVIKMPHRSCCHRELIHKITCVELITEWNSVEGEYRESHLKSRNLKAFIVYYH